MENLVLTVLRRHRAGVASSLCTVAECGGRARFARKAAGFATMS